MSKTCLPWKKKCYIVQCVMTDLTLFVEEISRSVHYMFVNVGCDCRLSLGKRVEQSVAHKIGDLQRFSEQFGVSGTYLLLYPTKGVCCLVCDNFVYVDLFLEGLWETTFLA